MDSNMISFKGVAEAADHFEQIRVRQLCSGVPDSMAGIGEQCVLTSGPSDVIGPQSGRSKRVVTAFWIKGIRASVAGTFGNRTVTVLSFKEPYVVERNRRASTREQPRRTWRMRDAA
jgi:hypothetical protein